MTTLFLIDNKENSLALIEKAFGSEHSITRGNGISNSQTVRELAVQTLAQLSNRPGNTVLLINVDLTFGQETGRFRGIELLTWLRINDITNPAVLYSRLRAQNIGREKVKNL